nr:MAG TPA: hypothetical protein [Caudoviricetes sp.]
MPRTLPIAVWLTVSVPKFFETSTQKSPNLSIIYEKKS